MIDGLQLAPRADDLPGGAAGSCCEVPAELPDPTGPPPDLELTDLRC
jgi:hypothetical protein